MRVLALDTSGMTATVAVVDENKTVVEFSINYKKTHSQTIMPMIENIANIIELDMQTIDYIAVASGPGSFTGLRIGAATAKGLAHGINKPIVPVPTLDGLAYNIFGADKIICPIMDARRNQVYSAFYLWNENNLERLSDYLVEPIEDIIDMAEDFDSEVIFLGDAVMVHSEILKSKLEDNCLFAPQNCNMQRAASIGALAIEMLKNDVAVNYAEFAPFYLRKSQAEREYENKHRA